MRRVLICKLGEDKKDTAKKFKETIFSFPQLETEIVDMDTIGSWSCFSREAEKFSENFDFVLGFLSPNAHKKLLVNCQATFLAGQNRNFKLIRFIQKESWLLGDFPSINGTHPEEMSNLLQEIANISGEKAKEWIDFCFTRLKETVSTTKQLHQEKEQVDVNKIKDTTTELAKQIEEEVKGNQGFGEQGNVWLQIVILISVAKTLRAVTVAKNDYTIPIALYSQYLIELQDTYKAKVSAVSTIKSSDSFWPRETSIAIANTTHAKSRRVFVFMEEKDFDLRFQMLLIHAEKYDVCVMSYETLTDVMRYGIAESFLPISPDDFAIFGDPNQYEERIIAEYLIEEDEYERRSGFVRFSTDYRRINGYTNKFEEITARAQSMKLAESRIKSKVKNVGIKPEEYGFSESVKIHQIDEEVRIEFRELVFKKSETEKLFNAIRLWNRQHLEKSFAITEKLLKETFVKKQKEVDEFFRKFEKSIQRYHQSIGIQDGYEHNRDQQKFESLFKQFIENILFNDVY